MGKLINISKQFLINEYVINKKNSVQIAKEINCSYKTVTNKLELYHIKIRSLSEAAKLSTHNKGKNHHNYIDGRCKKQYYCKDCGRKIGYDAIRHGGAGLCVYCCNKGTRSTWYGKTREESQNWKGGKIKVKCVVCQKEKEIDKCQLKTRINHFCSYKCAGKWQSIHRLGKNHPNYIHGGSRASYPPEFNNKLKLKIRQRDNYICQNCNITEEEHIIVFGKVLSVHHIDYDKANLIGDNLISLCHGCHNKTNANRKYWTNYFQQIDSKHSAPKSPELTV